MPQWPPAQFLWRHGEAAPRQDERGRSPACDQDPGEDLGLGCDEAELVGEGKGYSWLIQVLVKLVMVSSSCLLLNPFT